VPTFLLILALVVAAMVLFLLEILTPMFGLLGALAFGALLWGVLLAFGISTALGWIMMLALIVLVPAYLFGLVKWLPQTALGRRVFLKRVKDAKGSGTPEVAKHESMVGKTGLAETDLRPSGAIRIAGQRIIALTESGMIEKGDEVKVIRAEAMNVIVRKLEP